jgi:hypothetical protein
MTDDEWEENFEYEHFEPTTTIRPMRKELKKFMVKFNAAHAKINAIHSQMRNSEDYKEKEKARRADEEEMFDSTCMICYKFFEAGDEYRIMPGCKHQFHSESCIDKWLKTSDHCPTCKQEVQATGAKLDVEDSWDFADRLEGACGVKPGDDQMSKIIFGHGGELSALMGKADEAGR